MSQRNANLALDEFRRDSLTVAFLEFGFVVEEIEVGWSSGHEEVDDVLRFRREVRRFDRHRIRVRGREPGWRRRLSDETGEGDLADTGGGSAEKLATVHRQPKTLFEVHRLSFGQRFVQVEQNVSDEAPSREVGGVPVLRIPTLPVAAL